MNKKTYLVTGEIGFIGSNLCLSLLKANAIVTVIDNYDDYYNPLIKVANYISLAKFENFDFIDSDILNIDSYQSRLLPKYDGLIHLAAVPGVRNSFKNPERTFDVNVNGTTKMCELATKMSIPKFVLASSSSVYGINERVPWSESDKSLIPISPYAESKLKAEAICQEYSNKYNTGYDILRFFSVYGPNQRPDLAILKFISLIKRGKKFLSLVMAILIEIIHMWMISCQVYLKHFITITKDAKYLISETGKKFL